MSTNKRNRKENICNGIGINDMPFNWFSETDENKKIYYLWSGMINRCYNEKNLEKRSTYRDVDVCERWLILSNFVKDVKLLENYNLWLLNKDYQLDKDIKCDELGMNCKIYSKETCKFITKSENSSYASKNRDYSKLTGENSPNYGKKHTDETKQKLREQKLGSKNPNYGKPMKNKEQLIEINKRKIIVEKLDGSITYKFNSIKDACEFLSKIENKTFKGTNITKICKYNENPDEYYKKIGKRAKQYKGYTYYYDRGDE